LAALLPGGAAPAAELTLRATRPGQPPVLLRAAPQGESWQIGVLDAAGRVVQRIEAGDPEQGRPSLGDADGDGAADLWVPTMRGNANTEYEIRLMNPASGRFHEAATVSGVQFRRDGGHLVAMARSSCCAMEYGFYRRGADHRLVLAFSIGRTYAASGKTESCEAAAGADPAPPDIHRRWCAPKAEQAPPGRPVP
jgi:hypothetical protein